MPATSVKTTQWVMFQNAGEADFYALFLVGFTDKASDPRAIGMFGSGFKLAVTSAFRLGIAVILFIGRTKITLKTARRKVQGADVDQLVFVVEQPDGTVKEHATSLTLGYGARDWKDAWGIYREMLANCRDADPHYDVVHGVEPRGREGFTRVFVEATAEILAIYRDSDRFFREERHAIFSCDEGRIYPKSAQDGETWFYCKGMYVLTTPDTSLYDLDLYRMPLNEARSASTANLLTHVLRLFDQAPPALKEEIIRFAIENSNQGQYTIEGNLYWPRSTKARAWVDAFRRAFPDTVLCGYSDVEYESMRRMGRKAVRAPRGLYSLLERNGVLTATRILREEHKEAPEVFQPTGRLADYYAKAFGMLSGHLPEINRLNVTFVRMPKTNRQVSFITCSRSAGVYQFTDRLLATGPKAIALALVDALAQTKSLSGRCDPRYEEALMQMVLECVGD